MNIWHRRGPSVEPGWQHEQELESGEAPGEGWIPGDEIVQICTGVSDVAWFQFLATGSLWPSPLESRLLERDSVSLLIHSGLLAQFPWQEENTLPRAQMKTC